MDPTYTEMVPSFKEDVADAWYRRTRAAYNGELSELFVDDPHFLVDYEDEYGEYKNVCIGPKREHFPVAGLDRDRITHGGGLFMDIFLQELTIFYDDIGTKSCTVFLGKRGDLELVGEHEYDISWKATRNYLLKQYYELPALNQGGVVGGGTRNERREASKNNRYKIRAFVIRPWVYWTEEIFTDIHEINKHDDRLRIIPVLYSVQVSPLPYRMASKQEFRELNKQLGADFRKHLIQMFENDINIIHTGGVAGDVLVNVNDIFDNPILLKKYYNFVE